MNVQNPYEDHPGEIFNVALEQALLGTLLLNPHAIPGVALSPDVFYDAVHRDLYTAMLAKARGGALVSPITMKAFADQHAGFEDLGGASYLVTLAASAVGRPHDYAPLLAETAAKRRAVAIMENACAELRREESRAGDVSAKVSNLLAMAAEASRSGPVSMAQATREAMQQAKAAYEGSAPAGIRSGIGALDRMIPAFRPGEMIVIGGRPSMGKSAVALCMALNAARSGQGVGIASLEMTPEALAVRAVAEATGGQRGSAIAYTDIVRGDWREDQGSELARAAAEVDKLPISILPMHLRDIGAIRAGMMQAKATTLAKTGLGLVIIDYLQIVQMAGASRYEKVTEISVALKAMAAQMGVPVVVLAQLNRGVEQRDDKRPMLSDLKESGQLEQDADAVILCYRDEYYLERDQPNEQDSLEDRDEWHRRMRNARHRLELIVAKQRQGPIGTATVGFNPAINYTWDI